MCVSVCACACVYVCLCVCVCFAGVEWGAKGWGGGGAEETMAVELYYGCGVAGGRHADAGVGIGIGMRWLHLAKSVWEKPKCS